MTTRRWIVLLVVMLAGMATWLVIVRAPPPVPESAALPAKTVSHPGPELVVERSNPAKPPEVLTFAPPPVLLRVPEPVVPELPPLPTPGPDASVQEVRTWIENQAARMVGERRMSRKDPVIDEFARLSPAHWGLLLSYVEQFKNNFKARGVTEEALIRSVQPEHRDLVLAAFPKHTFLIEAIIKGGWISESAVTLRSMLADKKFTSNRFGDTARIVEALATLRDPQDFALLTDVLCRSKYGSWQATMTRSLATMPEFDLEGAVRAAWRHLGRKEEYQDHQDAFAVAAARAGIAEALPLAVLHALGGEGTAWSSGQLQEEARALLWDHFGVKADPEDAAPTLAWWESAKDQVQWDAQAHRWIGPRPAAKPVVTPPVSEPGANDF